MALVENRDYITEPITKRRGRLMKSSRIDKAIRSAKASLAVEGLNVTDREEALVKERLAGKITEAEFKKKVMELINE